MSCRAKGYCWRLRTQAAVIYWRQWLIREKYRLVEPAIQPKGEEKHGTVGQASRFASTLAKLVDDPEELRWMYPVQRVKLHGEYYRLKKTLFFLMFHVKQAAEK